MTPSGFLIPGPQDMSRQLVKFNLHDAMMQSKTSFQRGILGNKGELIFEALEIYSTRTVLA